MTHLRITWWIIRPEITNEKPTSAVSYGIFFSKMFSTVFEHKVWCSVKYKTNKYSSNNILQYFGIFSVALTLPMLQNLYICRGASIPKAILSISNITYFVLFSSFFILYIVISFRQYKKRALSTVGMCTPLSFEPGPLSCVYFFQKRPPPSGLCIS